MSRLVLILFALLLPLQSVWASAASYCQHETEPRSALHFGHHEHVHQGSGVHSGASPLVADADCGVCHAGGASLPGTEPVVPTLAVERGPVAASTGGALESALVRAPDRPQWRRLV